MTCKRFTPTEGEVYELRTGGRYRCEQVKAPGCAVMERENDGWNLVAHGLMQNPDGTIEWDYSTGGHWGGGER